MEWEVRLYLVGRWLEVRDARSVDLTIIEDGVRVACEDRQGREQRRRLTAAALEHLYLLGRHARATLPSEERLPWGASLRALGQTILQQGIEPVRIWSDGEQLSLYGLRQGRSVRDTYELPSLAAFAPVPSAAFAAEVSREPGVRQRFARWWTARSTV